MNDCELIERVEQFELLYNKKNVNFKNKVKRENAWETISSIMGGVTPQECDQRWTVLRNKYATMKRSLKNSPSGSQAYTVSWPYFNSMKFLDPHIQARKTISNFSQSQQSGISLDINFDDDVTQITEVEENPHRDVLDESVEETSETDTSGTNTTLSRYGVPPTKKLKRDENERQKESQILNSNWAEIRRLRANNKNIPKPQDIIVHKLGGCLDTLGKLIELEQSSSQRMDKEDEDFARSLTRDLAIFTAVEKIFVEKKSMTAWKMFYDKERNKYCFHDSITPFVI